MLARDHGRSHAAAKAILEVKSFRAGPTGTHRDERAKGRDEDGENEESSAHRQGSSPWQ